MIRESIARHSPDPHASAAAPATVEAQVSSHAGAAFIRVPLTSGDDQGMCVIEPSVRCNHCGYCLSYGH